MRILGVLVCAAFTSLAAPAAGQDVIAASAAHRDLQEICAEDRGRLWGVDLCGPLLIADPADRSVWASQPAADLRNAGAGWVGALPPGTPIANASVTWAGERWIMVMAPLPADQTDRRVLVGHEAWHRVQDQLGLPQGAANCLHLEQERGRVLLRLEFRALATALRSRGRARDNAVRDALIFRYARLAAFPEAAAQEAALDRNEGLASYTGVRLGVRENPDLYAARTLDTYDSHEAFARAYAYASGPAYGLILDRKQPAWRTELGAFAPADLLVSLLRPRIGDTRRLADARERYGGLTVAAEERTRAAAQQERIAQLRARFSEGPRLVISVSNLQMEFDPNGVTPVEGLGSVYRTLVARDRFGEVRASDGALINSTFSEIILPNPAPDGLSGPGWTLTLAPSAQIGPPELSGARRVTAP